LVVVVVIVVVEIVVVVVVVVWAAEKYTERWGNLFFNGQ